MPNAYNPGSLVTLSAVFTVNGQKADPDTVTLKIRRPDGTTEEPAVIHDGVGEYHYDLDVATHSGQWVYLWTGQGNVKASEEKKFQVRKFELD
jgi:hypothetical protein